MSYTHVISNVHNLILYFISLICCKNLAITIGSNVLLLILLKTNFKLIFYICFKMFYFRALLSCFSKTSVDDNISFLLSVYTLPVSVKGSTFRKNVSPGTFKMSLGLG